MVLGSIGYVINDGLVRKVADQGLDVYQVLCLRSAGLAVLMYAVGQVRSEPFRRAHLQSSVLTRVAAEMLAGVLFFAAVVRIEFANAQAILLLVPFAVTMTAAVVLNERVSILRYLTVALGFLGVVIVIRPATEGFSAASLFAVAAAVVLVVRELSTRDVPPEIPAVSIGFATAVGMTAVTGALALIAGWAAPTAGQLGLLVIAFCSLYFGYYFTIQTVRVGDLSVSAPFRYTTLVGAVIIGIVLFDEVPDMLTIVGISIIFLTGVYSVYLERTEAPAE